MKIPRDLGEKLRSLPGDWQTQSSMLENYSLETTYAVLQRFEVLYREKHKFIDWMAGQTVGVTEKGDVRYYCYDVERYKE